MVSVLYNAKEKSGRQRESYRKTSGHKNSRREAALSGQAVLPAESLRDPLGFNRMYAGYRNRILAEINTWTFNPDLSKDLCQEIFLKAWYNLEKYDPSKGRVSTWLLGITRNHCKDYLRSKQFKRGRLTCTFDTVSEPAHEESTTGMQHLHVRELLLCLPPELQEMMELLFVQGFTQTDVATLKQLPLGTVKSRSRAAIRLLRDFLSEPGRAFMPAERSGAIEKEYNKNPAVKRQRSRQWKLTNNIKKNNSHC